MYGKQYYQIRAYTSSLASGSAAQREREKEKTAKMISDAREQISKIRTGDFGNSNFSSIEKAPNKYEIRKEVRKEAQKIKYAQQRECSKQLAEKEATNKQEITKEVEKQAQKIKSDIEEQYLKQWAEKEEDNSKKEKLASQLRYKVISLQDNLLQETSRSEYNHQKFLDKKSKIDSIKVKLNNFINSVEGIDNQRELLAEIFYDLQSQAEMQQGPDDSSIIASNSQLQSEIQGDLQMNSDFTYLF